MKALLFENELDRSGSLDDRRHGDESAEALDHGSQYAADPTKAPTGPKWPLGFKMRDTGLWFDAEGDDPPLRLCGPFTVPGLARDPNGAGWATTIRRSRLPALTPKAGLHTSKSVPRYENMKVASVALKPSG